MTRRGAPFMSDELLEEKGWRAVARNQEGRTMSLMAPGYFDEYLGWIREMEGHGYIITEFPKAVPTVKVEAV